MKNAKRPRVVQGFGVRNQLRKRFRGGPMTGVYRGHAWTLFCEETELFQWRIAGFVDYSGPTIAHALRAMKKAARVADELIERHGEVPEEATHVLGVLMRWERRAIQGRLKIEGPLGRGDEKWHRVKET